jgi:hypothetical protein
MTAPACRCEAPDARACLTQRYDVRMLLDREVCGCECHGEAPTDRPVLYPSEVRAVA